MSKRISEEQRKAILGMLARGEDRDTIGAAVGVNPGQVSAIADRMAAVNAWLREKIDELEVTLSGTRSRGS